MSVSNPLDRSYEEGEEDDFVSPFTRSDNMSKESLSYPTSSNNEEDEDPLDTSINTSSSAAKSTANVSTTTSPPIPQVKKATTSTSSSSTTDFYPPIPQVKKSQPKEVPIIDKADLPVHLGGTGGGSGGDSSSSASSTKKPQWVPDNASNSCEMCQVPFSLFKRRHHCRRCGHLFCSDCCSLNVSLPQDFGYIERVRVCSKCFTVTLNDRAKEETSITMNVGGVSNETKVVSKMNKVLLWKMGAHEDGDFDRTVADSFENYPSNAIPVSRVQDFVLESSDLDVQGCTGFKVRIYNPALEPGERSAVYPILMWFHTGGFVTKSVETPSVDGLCRLLSNQAGCVVVSVDYRLAPEHPFPAAALDCFAATCWAIKNASKFDGDPSRVVVAGDSAGGNLAATVALMARDKESPKLMGQVLIYPILDLKRNEDKYYTRIVHNDGYIMPMSYFNWFASKYCRSPSDYENPYASPLRAATTTKSLTGLPVTMVITAGQDPFCDEGELYVKKLRSSNVKVYHTRYTNSPHGFFAMGIDESNEAVMEVAIALKYMFKRLY